MVKHLTEPDRQSVGQIDRGSNYNIRGVTLIPRTVSNGTVSLRTSNSSTAQTEVPGLMFRRGQSYTGYASTANNNGEVFTFASPFNVRYIRLVGTRFRQDDYVTYYLKMCEMYI